MHTITLGDHVAYATTPEVPLGHVVRFVQLNTPTAEIRTADGASMMAPLSALIVTEAPTRNLVIRWDTIATVVVTFFFGLVIGAAIVMEVAGR